MIRVTLMDGSFQEVRRDEVLGLFPARGLLRHPLLQSEALILLNGKLIPVAGPLPDSLDISGPVEERPWLMLFRSHAQVVCGLPKFDDDIAVSRPSPELVTGTAFVPDPPAIASEDDEEARLLQEMEELLKSA